MHLEDIVKVVAMIFVSCGVKCRNNHWLLPATCFLFLTEPTMYEGIGLEYKVCNLIMRFGIFLPILHIE